MLPPPRDDDAAGRPLLAPQFLHDHANVVAGGEKEHLVAVLDDGRALGNHAFAGAVDRSHSGIGRGDVLAQGLQRLTHQRAALQGADADQPHAAVGEIQDLERAGIADQTGDVLGDQLFGADPDIDGDAAFAEQPLLIRVIRRSNARDLLRGAIERPGDLACQHVDFVAVGQRDQDVGAGDAGGFQNPRARGIAVDRADVEAILEIAQDLLVHIDDGYIVRLFAREMVRRRTADLSGTQDDDFHSGTLHHGTARAHHPAARPWHRAERPCQRAARPRHEATRPRDWRRTTSTTSCPCASKFT